MRKINAEGLALIKTFEGCRLTVYADLKGLPTVGYGHMDPSLQIGQHYTQEQCDALLEADLAKFETGVEDLVKVPLTDNQFSALVCFTYNIGLGRFATSGVLRLLNEDKNYAAAAAHMLLWDRVDGNEVEGLHQRRESERSLFLKGETA